MTRSERLNDAVETKVLGTIVVKNYYISFMSCIKDNPSLPETHTSGLVAKKY